MLIYCIVTCCPIQVASMEIILFYKHTNKIYENDVLDIGRITRSLLKKEKIQNLNMLISIFGYTLNIQILDLKPPMQDDVVPFISHGLYSYIESYGGLILMFHTK